MTAATVKPSSRDRALEQLRCYTKAEPSPFGARVAELLDLWQGLHHIPVNSLLKADWQSERWISLVTSRSLDTYDCDDLTRLVFLAHALCIRVEISGAAPGYLRLSFSRRNGRTGGSVWSRHPTPEQALSRFRSYFPVGHDEPTSNDDPAATMESIP